VGVEVPFELGDGGSFWLAKMLIPIPIGVEKHI